MWLVLVERNMYSMNTKREENTGRARTNRSRRNTGENLDSRLTLHGVVDFPRYDPVAICEVPASPCRICPRGLANGKARDARFARSERPILRSYNSESAYNLNFYHPTIVSRTPCRARRQEMGGKLGTVASYRTA